MGEVRPNRLPTLSFWNFTGRRECKACLQVCEASEIEIMGSLFIRKLIYKLEY